MDKANRTKTELEYARFDIISKIAMCFILMLTIVLIMIFLFAKTDEWKILFGLLLMIDTVVIIFVASKITNKRTTYLQKLQNERNGIKRTGLFKEVYDAHRHDGFEFSLIYDKLLYEEYHNNAIDIGVLKNNHEFSIVIDEKTISMIVDEETEQPIEEEIPIADISTMDQIYLIINGFINGHS